MTIRKIIYSFATAILTGVAVTSCISNDEEQYAPDNGEPKTVSISLSATPYGKATRADFPEHPAEANELIQEWFVAIVDESGGVVAVDQGTNVGGAWNDVVNVDLELYKKYTAFAFANFNNTNSKAVSSEAFAANLGLTNGSNVNIQNLKNAIFSGAADKDHLSSEELIPMAGYLEFTPNGTVNETFAIEVVRLYSRVEFAFVKNTTDNISITNIALQPVNTGSVFLLPNYGEKPIPDNKYPDKAPNLPDGVNYKPINVGIEKSVVPIDEADKDISERHRFYIKESIAEGNHPTDHFHIGITLKRDDQTEEIASYALADDDLKFFFRNDYVLFPIVISDYRPMLNVYDYPPIGGYPVQVENKGTEFYATFSSSGAFDIDARLIDSTGKELTVDDTPGAEKTYNVQCDYDKEIYKGLNLTYDPTTRRWNGYFEMGAENKMNEPIVITFTFTIDKLRYTRTLYLRSK